MVGCCGRHIPLTSGLVNGHLVPSDYTPKDRPCDSLVEGLLRVCSICFCTFHNMPNVFHQGRSQLLRRGVL